MHADLRPDSPLPRLATGSLARWLSDLMFSSGGLSRCRTIGSWGAVADGSRETYLQAVMEGYLHNYTPLGSFFVEAVRRRERREPLRSTRVRGAANRGRLQTLRTARRSRPASAFVFPDRASRNWFPPGKALSIHLGAYSTSNWTIGQELHHNHRQNSRTPVWMIHTPAAPKG